MKLSQSTFVYFRYPLEEAIKRLAEEGYEGVEIWGGRPHAYWEDMSDERIENLKRLLKEKKMEISNFIPAQFRYPTNLASTDEHLRGKSVEYIKRNIDVAEKLEAPYVSLCPGFSIYGENLQKCWNAMIKSFKEIIEYSKDKKVKLILEPAHAMETDLVRTVDEGIRVIEEVGKENMGLCLDTGHIFINKEALVDIPEKVKDYLVHYHIDDNGGISDDHLVPGEGKIDFTIFLEKLKKMNYQGFLAVELGYGYTNDPDNAVRRSREFLKKYF